MHRGDAEATAAIATTDSSTTRTALNYSSIITYALLAAFARPLTLPARAAILLPGTALLLWGVRRAPIQPVRVTQATVVTWFGLGVLFCAWELVAYYSGNDPGHPTFSILTDPIFATYPGRVVGYLLWLTTGFWLASR